MVTRLERSIDHVIHITVALTTAGCPLRAQLMRDAKARVASLPDIDIVEIHFGEMTADERSNVMLRARWKARDNALETDIHGPVGQPRRHGHHYVRLWWRTATR